VVPKVEFLSAMKRLELQDGFKDSGQKLNYSEQDQSNPGLLLDLSNALHKQRRYKEVLKILRKVSRSSEFLGNPQKWKKLRVYHARRALRLGNYELAYELASKHFIEPENLTNGQAQRVQQDYVDLEFLAGFISINFLKKPRRALKHFARSAKLVKNEINVSKSYYWYARSLYELNQLTEAEAAFLVASRYLSTFYGQLAAERINTKDLTLDFIEKHQINCDREKIMENDILKTGVLLLNADRIVLGVRFFKHLAETLPIDDRVCLVKFLHKSGNWSGVIGITKKFLLKDQSVIQYGYPVLQSIKGDLGGRPPLIHAIIRQESEFYSGARSSAGALGLMQIMPNTAKYLAGRLGLKYDKRRMLKDEIYNIKLGTKYVKELLQSFRGSVVLSIAAYNAGPGSVKRWLKSYGDPRKMGVDPLVWIEMIPYDETRNYVTRVLSNELVYRAILGKKPLKFDRAQKNFGHRF
jgi:soluble lytic murein transglycosylase